MTKQDLESIKTRQLTGEIAKQVILSINIALDDSTYLTDYEKRKIEEVVKLAIDTERVIIESLLGEVEKEKVAYSFALREIERLMKESQRYRTALEKYGQHKEDCHIHIKSSGGLGGKDWSKHKFECSCGLESLLPREGNS